jgi:hypothetical protein
MSMTADTQSSRLRSLRSIARKTLMSRAPAPRIAAYHIGLAIASVIGLAACASRPSIRTDGDPTTNLSSYKTFGFFDRLSTDQSAYTTILTSRLKESTRRELESRGYQYAQTSPQLVVNFYVNVQNRTGVQSTPTAGGYYGYRAGMYHGWAGYPQGVETVHYKEGTLGIDLVDASKQQLVWQGIAEGKIKKAALEDPAAAIDRVVQEIFAKFPTPGAPKTN